MTSTTAVEKSPPPLPHRLYAASLAKQQRVGSVSWFCIMHSCNTSPAERQSVGGFVSGGAEMGRAYS